WRNRKGGGGTLRRRLRGVPTLPEFRQTPFIGVDKLERGLNIGTLGHSCLSFPAYHHFRNFVVPAALPHEFVPNVNVVRSWFAADRETPIQNILIGAALFDALDQPRVIDAEKLHAFFIKTLSHI